MELLDARAPAVARDEQTARAFTAPVGDRDLEGINLLALAAAKGSQPQAQPQRLAPRPQHATRIGAIVGRQASPREPLVAEQQVRVDEQHRRFLVQRAVVEHADVPHEQYRRRGLFELEVGGGRPHGLARLLDHAAQRVEPVDLRQVDAGHRRGARGLGQLI